MSCVTFTEFASMATTQLTRAVCKPAFWSPDEPQSSPQRRPRLNWVVVTDSDDTRQLRMQWNADTMDV